MQPFRGGSCRRLTDVPLEPGSGPGPAAQDFLPLSKPLHPHVRFFLPVPSTRLHQSQVPGGGGPFISQRHMVLLVVKGD